MRSYYISPLQSEPVIKYLLPVPVYRPEARRDKSFKEKGKMKLDSRWHEVIEQNRNILGLNQLIITLLIER
uniref:Uncharacterized protein n=1 Tax=Lepeophtheirus salmonis TaxID=72036 RepID=A0A0K2VJB0_LEPSM